MFIRDWLVVSAIPAVEDVLVADPALGNAIKNALLHQWKPVRVFGIKEKGQRFGYFTDGSFGNSFELLLLLVLLLVTSLAVEVITQAIGPAWICDPGLICCAAVAVKCFAFIEGR